MITPDDARTLAVLEEDAFERQLAEHGMLDESGMDEVLRAAQSAMRDDPAVGERLARLISAVGARAGIDAAIPRAGYLLAQSAAADGDMTRALALIDDAARGFHALGLHDEGLRTNLGRTQALNEMGLHRDALAACAHIIDSVGEPPPGRPDLIALVAAAHQNSGLCLELTGDFAGALEHYAAATIGYEALGDDRAVAEVSYDRGLALTHLGEHVAALGALERARETFSQDGFRALEVMALTNIADVLLLRGQYEECLSRVADALARLDGIDWPAGEHWPLLAAGRAALALNLLPEARSYFEQAVALLRPTDLAIDIARAEWGHGRALALAGEARAAATALGMAVEQFERSGNPTWLVHTLVDLGEVLDVVGDHEGAADALRRARERAVAGSPGWVAAQLATARQTNGMGAGEIAQVVSEVDRLGLEPLTVSALHAQGRALLREGRADDAVVVLQGAVDAIERLRLGLSSELTLARFLDDKQGPYLDLLDALVHSGAAATECVEVVEQAKSRTLNELLAGLVERGVDNADTADHADLHAAYAELFAGVDDRNPDQSAALHRRVRERETTVAMRRAVQSPRMAGSRGAPKALRSDVRVPVVDYVVTHQAIRAFVTVEGVTELAAAIDLAAVGSAAAKLRQQLGRLRLGADLAQRHAAQLLSATRSTLADLHALVWLPVTELVGYTHPHMVVSPDGLLHDLPFHALWDGDRYVLDDTLITYTPSIGTLANLPQPREGRIVVAGTADELAPEVEREIIAVAALTGADVELIGDAARWDDVAGWLTDASLVHLAGHAIFRPDNPMYSALRFADRWVTASEVLGTRLDGASVVISACDTGRTEHQRSAEINGFVRAFLGAGASSIVSSLWSADDAATVALMNAFYRHGRAGLSLPEALRAAQLEIAQDWQHPYYWAPWTAVAPVTTGHMIF